MQPADIMLNPGRRPAGSAEHALISTSTTDAAREFLRGMARLDPTPLRPLPGFAERCGVREVLVKDETGRLGLGSFKALGGAYAVARQVACHAEEKLGRTVGAANLGDPDVRAIAGELTMVCASAGNHGLAVAWGARCCGARAEVYLGSGVPASFEARLRGLGASVHRVAGSYQRSVEAASGSAARPGRILVADTASDGYRDIPLEVMRGYTVLAAEAADQCEALGVRPSHVFAQAGVGGLAGAVTGYLRDRWGEDVGVVVVEPAGAACLLASLRAGQLTEITTTGTSLGRLDCDRPSSVAWDLLTPLADAFLTIADADADRAAQLLTDEAVAVSACGAAGAAGLLVFARSREARTLLGLDEHSRVLLIGTEEATGDGGQPG